MSASGEEGVFFGPGDRAKLDTDYDGYPAIKIENHALVEEPRWIGFSGMNRFDRDILIDDLITALEQLQKVDPS